MDTSCGAVLGVSLLLEGYSLFVATRAVAQGAADKRVSFWEYVVRCGPGEGADPEQLLHSKHVLSGHLMPGMSAHAAR